MKRFTLLMAVTAVIACDRGVRNPSGQVVSINANQIGLASPVKVHFPRYQPPSRGGPEAFMEAGMGGVLTVRGPCLGLADTRGEDFRTVVWTTEASFGHDRLGLYVTRGKDRFRPGDEMEGGGGTMPSDFSDTRLQAPFPTECDRSRAIEFHSFTRRGETFGRVPPIALPPPPSPGQP